ncbi:ankyrin repeat domain-containing protein [Candidatus Babeliales bacterium]|nr:ankyrin repeat domain-containing protein [Candidatus Babeliales bacterium]
MKNIKKILTCSLFLTLILTTNVLPAASSSPASNSLQNADVLPEIIVHASAGDAKELQKYLKKNKKIDINTIFWEGKNTLHWAAEKGHTECVKLLLATKKKGVLKKRYTKPRANVNAASLNAGLTALALAVIGNHLPCAEVLIEHGADVNCQNTMGLTALHIAANNGWYDCLKLLLDNQANVATAPTEGEYINITALHLAAQNGHLACIELLLNRGAHVSTPGAFPTQRTCVHLAAEGGRTTCLALLLQNGGLALIDAQDAETFEGDTRINVGGSTALHLAIQCNAPACAQLLLHHGANQNIPDSDGFTPLQWAIVDNVQELYQLLLEDPKLTINAQNKYGETALHHAVEANNVTATTMLLERGANPTIKNNNNQTPAILAASLNHHAVAILFIPQTEKKPSTSISKETCSICLGDFEEHETYAHLNCGHDFHEDCIKNAARIELETNDHLRNTIGANYKKQATCPLCRTATEFTRDNNEPTTIRVFRSADTSTTTQPSSSVVDTTTIPSADPVEMLPPISSVLPLVPEQADSESNSQDTE